MFLNILKHVLKMELKNIQSDWKDFGGRNYIVRKLYQCFGLLGDRYGLVPCPYGGPFLKNRLRPSTFFDFIANNGEKAVSRDIQCEDNIYRIFWCAGGKIGILTILGTDNEVKKKKRSAKTISRKAKTER